MTDFNTKMHWVGFPTPDPAWEAYSDTQILQQYLKGHKGKGKGRCSSSWEPHLCHMGSHIGYLPPDTSECDPPNLSHVGWYWIYLPRRDGRLSWPSWLDSARPGVEPATFRSRVRRRRAAPPRQPAVTQTM